MIWLIGNKGMLGTGIARQLTENKIDFVGTDREVDITDPQALAVFATGKQISYIINCSAYTAVDKAESDVELAKKLNEDGPRNIANLANVINATMIHISTDYVSTVLEMSLTQKICQLHQLEFMVLQKLMVKKQYVRLLVNIIFSVLHGFMAGLVKTLYIQC